MDSLAFEVARKNSKTCQIEGCHELTVGSRTTLCRKHRNNRYKQNYKKKKRKTQGSEEIQSESLENQLAEEKCLMEQKYASMLQQVLAQKQLELLQSEKVIQVLRAHQRRVKEEKIKEIQERKEKKEHELPKETLDLSLSLSGVVKDGLVPEKSPSKASKSTKSSGKTNQSKKNSNKGSPSKDARLGNNLSFPRNMENVSTPPLPDLVPAGISVPPYLGNRNGNYSGQNPYGATGSPQLTPIQPTIMSPQQIPKIEKVFSYQPALSAVSNSSKVCVDAAVKDLSPGNHGKGVAVSSNQPRPAPGGISQHSATNMNNLMLLSSKAAQSTQTRLLQNLLPYPTVHSTILSSTNITSQAGQTRPSYQNMMTPCSSTSVSTGGSSSIGAGMPHQRQMSFPITNFSQTMSLPNNSQIVTTGTCTRTHLSSQLDASQNWSNRMAQGRLQAPSVQDDFLLQMLQENKEQQVQLGAQSQTNSGLTSLDHVIPDSSWAAMTIGI